MTLLKDILTNMRKGGKTPKMLLPPHWRRCGDLNPSAGRTDLPDFESGPFNHLGTSPYMKLYFCYLRIYLGTQSNLCPPNSKIPSVFKASRPLRFHSPHRISSAAPSTSRTTLRVYISIRFFFAQISFKKFLERKAGENTKKYSIFDFENPYIWGFRRTKRPSRRKISSQSRHDHFATSPNIPT